MSLTLTTFAANLLGMSVTGVARIAEAPPQQLNSASMPFMYPRVPETQNGAVVFTSVAGLDVVQLELVVIVEAATVNTYRANFAKVKTVIDGLGAALKAEAIARNQIDRWEIHTDSENEYWVIVAVVEGSG